MTTQDHPTQTLPDNDQPAGAGDDPAAVEGRHSSPEAGLPDVPTESATADPDYSAERPQQSADPESLSVDSEPSPADPSTGPQSETPLADEPPAPQQETQVQRSETATRQPETANVGAVSTSAEPAGDKPLFADDALSGLRSRWDDVQAGFVDDPRECVQKADGLVSDVVEQLTAGFSQARTRLEEQWGRGEEASTEDLRIALKGYREFFQRLLAV